MDRNEAVRQLREFNARLDAQPDHAKKARSGSLELLLGNLVLLGDREHSDNAKVFLAAVRQHGLTWADCDPADIAADVAGSMIAAKLKTPIGVVVLATEHDVGVVQGIVLAVGLLVGSSAGLRGDNLRLGALILRATNVDVALARRVCALESDVEIVRRCLADGGS